jgi:hypothetical protein
MEEEALEREWQVEAAKARKIAKRRGLTVEAIDREIERRRYGNKARNSSRSSRKSLQ